MALSMRETIEVSTHHLWVLTQASLMYAFQVGGRPIWNVREVVEKYRRGFSRRNIEVMAELIWGHLAEIGPEAEDFTVWKTFEDWLRQELERS
jgi:hypothetical protein